MQLEQFLSCIKSSNSKDQRNMIKSAKNFTILFLCAVSAESKSRTCWASPERIPRRFSVKERIASLNAPASLKKICTKPHSLSPSRLSVHSINSSIGCIANLRGGAFGTVNMLFHNYPYATAFSVCALKAGCADSLAQKLSSRSRSKSGKRQSFNFQYKRNLAFIAYGGLYQGCFQEYLYNELFSRLLGFDNSPSTAFKKVLFDVFIIAPLLCLPVAYLIKSIVYQQTFKEGLQKYVNDVVNHGLLTKKTLFWIPVNSAAFTVVPEHLRITFIACFSFFWLILMSSISG